MPTDSDNAKTAFLFDEHCLWFQPAQTAALTAPTGGWVQPVSGTSSVAAADGIRRLKSLLDVSGFGDKLTVSSAPQATFEQVTRVHAEEYVNRFKALSDKEGGSMGPAAMFAPGSYELVSLSTGLAVDAVERVMDGSNKRAYAACVPAGHHASKDQGMGSTIFANTAVAAQHALTAKGARRVAIVDWDVHHGNGTQSIFYDRDDVLTISLHQANCFPPGGGQADERGSGVGEGANINIPILPGSGNDEYVYAVDNLVVPALERFNPDLIIIGSGYDASTYDVLGHMQLHSGSYRTMTQSIVDLADRLGHGRVVMAHEGGYAEVYVPFCAIAAIEALSGLDSQIADPFVEFISQQRVPEDLAALQRQRVAQQAAEIGL